MSHRRHQSGLTLIEVLVVVTVAALLLALGMPSFTTGMQNREIRTAANAIQNGLQLARTEALRRNRVVKFELLEQNSWRVGCSPADSTVIDGEEVCPATIQARDAKEGSTRAEVELAELVAGTSTPVATPKFEGDIEFTPLGRTTDGTLPAGSVAVYRVSNPGGGSCAADGGEMRCLAVSVTAAGQVRMCDPAAAAGDPRAC